MPKTNYTPVADLEPFGGEKPCGVQVRVKGGTGPYVPRFIDSDDGVILILACQRGDLTLKHIDDLPVLRIDLDANEILEVTDRPAGMELMRVCRGERDRAISVASGYDGTFDEFGKPVHVDGDGTVLTPQEVAARQGLNVGPSGEEAAAWWAEQEYLDFDFADVSVDELVDLVGRLPLNEVEYIGVLEAEVLDPGESGRPKVLAAVDARVAAHAEAAAAPGWSPLEDGLPIAEARERVGRLSDFRIVADLLATERAGKGRKRVAQALGARLEALGDLVAEEPAVPPLPGEDEPVAAVDEEPFA